MLTDQKILRTFGPVLQITDGHKVHKYPHQYSHPTSSRHSQKCSGHFRASAMDGRAELLQFPDQEEQPNYTTNPVIWRPAMTSAVGWFILRLWVWSQQRTTKVFCCHETRGEASKPGASYVWPSPRTPRPPSAALGTWSARTNTARSAHGHIGRTSAILRGQKLEQPLLLPAKQPIKMSANFS